MFIGTRVVRGPDWSSMEQDGGEGHLGTIVDQSESDDKTVTVIWDTGRERIYKAKDNSFELRLFDNAQAGINHPNCNCSGCRVDTIWGIRWLCLDCGNVNLCTKCYMSDKHDVSHTFGRVVEPFHSVVKLSTRKSSKNTVCQAKGMFPKANVIRGPHWEWRNTDGGDGSEGIIDEICDWSRTSKRSAARVKWNKQKNIETYRLGAEGRVDLSYLEAADGYKYYKEHLPVVDLDFEKKAELNIGDKIQINLSQKQMKNLQYLSDGGWSEAMSQCLSEIGTVVQIIVPGLVRVQYQNGNMYSLNQLSLSKVHTFQKGDLVRVFGDKEMVSALQQGHGGWSDNYNQTLGKLGRVVDVDEDGDVLVVIDKIQNVFSPVCLDSVDEGTVESSQKVPPVPENLQTKRLFEPDRSNQETTRPRKSLISLVVGGDLALVEDFVKENPKAIDVEENGVTALQVACQKGHENIVKCLIKANANIDKTDKEGNTPLHICVENHKARVAKMLIENKAKLDVKNQNGMTPLHLAVSENRPVCVRHLVEGGADLHVKSPSGGTAVHDAISNEENHAVTEILKAKTIKFETENSDGFDMLQWACIKKCTIAVDMILSRDTTMVNRHMAKSKRSYTACHIAADNDLRDIMRSLLKKGKADVNSRDGLEQTPLHLAVKGGHLPMTELLLENGANVNCQDKDGNTPLHGTQILQTSPGFSDMDNDWASIACVLIEHGANLKVLNKENKSPLDIAPTVSKMYLQRLWKTAQQRQQEKKGAGGGLYLPLNWKDMTGIPLLFVSLNKTDPIEKLEYKHVEETLLKGLPKREVKEIIRVQNKYLWELYSIKKKFFENKLGRGNENEINLFHGTKPEVVQKICEENFDFRLAGENVGTMYGKGVYFAINPSLSDTYCSPDEQGYRHIIYAKVLAGRTTFGNSEMKKPPANYDSVVDFLDEPRIYCVFDFNQCYPEYIIKYK